ncbi:puromycin-sensitive aminopeptidase [Entamoeba histolytica HM-3:IMSS]|uniref:Aminopeptidase n=2 Tax=Entamoeba histolytica TaxID=5759 RepID=M2Q319_ENTHI|nr:puromycin-sensitive aminopeptidase, putative [Entamoeba histolytica KU27]EMS17454.1 puromycin-sensitive aminopeptidase [Entamoeba histolytica HM-3:IMSS]
MTEILPTNFIPLHYKIYVKPDPALSLNYGKTNIVINCIQPTDELILNGVGIKDIKSRCIKPQLHELVVKEDKEKEQLIFTGVHFEQGEYEIEIEYNGCLPADDLCGFYQSKYEIDGKTKIICCTQFEPSSARKAFPCFDEPNYKATFDIIMEVPKGDDCFSNMPIKVVTEHGEFKIVEFERTLKMSTYLIAFINGEFTSYYGETVRGIKLGLHFPRNHKNVSKFALETMSKCLTLYEQAYDIKYPLPKCDWIALPDFEAGAMENWGCVTSRESEVVLQENASSQSLKRCASVVCHELAHMWFGDLVTMKWWNDLWLNEGFASYMGDLFATATLFPEWHMNVSNEFESVLPALDSDGCISTHPISVPVKKASDIEQLFDLISYDKGSALIDMMINYVGFDKFMKGISLYLKKYMYGNAISDEMWECVGEVCGINLKDIVQEWTYKAGFPVVSVKIENNKLFISQERCGCKSEQLWKIPMILSCGEYKQTYLLTEKSACIEWNQPYVIANTMSTGFYRVQYSEQLLNILQHQTLCQIETMGILDDLYSLCKLGKVSSKNYLAFIETLKPFVSDTYQVARVVCEHLTELKNVFRGTEVAQFVIQQRERLLGPALQQLGLKTIPGEPIEDAKLRSLCLTTLNNQESIKEAFNVIEVGDLSKIDAEMRQPICSIAGRNATEPIFEKLCQLYLNGETPEIKRNALRGLGLVKNEEIIKKVIDFAVNKVRQQDFCFIMILSLLGESELPCQWVESHIDYINEKFGTGMSSIRNWILEGLLGHYSSHEKYQYYTQFFIDHPAVGSENTIKQSLEKMLNRADWIKRDLSDMISYLH